MNTYKARMAKWSLLRKELHDAIPLCNWMGPWSASPLKERGYRGDDSIESMLYSLVTGDQKSGQELDAVAERIFVLHRALTIRGMGTKEMRTMHDTILIGFMGMIKTGYPSPRALFRWINATWKPRCACFTKKQDGTRRPVRPPEKPIAGWDCRA